jgi:hypothetical protein
MCEQTEVRYLDGDIVWVKLGSCWWPGHVKDVDKLPEEILVSLKKRPIAAVKFFQEETLLVSIPYLRINMCHSEIQSPHNFIWPL